MRGLQRPPEGAAHERALLAEMLARADAGGGGGAGSGGAGVSAGPSRRDLVRLRDFLELGRPSKRALLDDSVDLEGLVRRQRKAAREGGGGAAAAAAAVAAAAEAAAAGGPQLAADRALLAEGPDAPAPYSRAALRRLARSARRLPRSIRDGPRAGEERGAEAGAEAAKAVEAQDWVRYGAGVRSALARPKITSALARVNR